MKNCIIWVAFNSSASAALSWALDAFPEADACAVAVAECGAIAFGIFATCGAVALFAGLAVRLTNS